MEYLTSVVDSYLSDPNLFHDVGRVHDWRNYVTEEDRVCWFELTLEVRRVIYTYCEVQASNEDWD